MPMLISTAAPYLCFLLSHRLRKERYSCCKENVLPPCQQRSIPFSEGVRFTGKQTWLQNLSPFEQFVKNLTSVSTRHKKIRLSVSVLWSVRAMLDTHPCVRQKHAWMTNGKKLLQLPWSPLTGKTNYELESACDKIWWHMSSWNHFRLIIKFLIIL